MSDNALDETYGRISRFITETMDATASGNQRKWFNFFDEEADSIPIYHPDYLEDIFNRERLNKNIINVIGQDPVNAPTSEAALGGLGVVITNTVQVDRLARWQRDLTGRFKTRVRGMAHRLSETHADGTDNCPLRSSLVRDMNDILLKNATGDNANPEEG